MILYKSTRGDKKSYTFSEAILKGIAEDGGLLVPVRIPKLSLSILDSLVGKSYQECALKILELFETDLDKEILKDAINQAYANNFDHPKIAPIVRFKDKQFIHELWHGPTAAFKDIALQLKPLLFSEAVKRENQKRIERGEISRGYLILVATSGDTGKAALEGYRDKAGVSIAVFYPVGGVSQLQELSMTTQEGSNVEVIGMSGDFDDTQRCVKETLNDGKFNSILWDRYQVKLSSANSINWGRLLPQIVYHISGYADLIEQGIIKLGEEIDIAIPTGNCGNIMAAYYAKKMGLPVHRLICASNANNILTQVLQTGTYDVSKRKLIKTPSPSMDILIASNFERLLYTITQDSEKIVSWMTDLKEKGQFNVDKATKKIFNTEFYADWVSNSDCLKTIRGAFNESGYLLDPHTAVAQEVVERYKNISRDNVPIIISSTAHWAKFATDVYKALTGKARDREEAKTMREKADEFTIISKIQALAPKAQAPQSILEMKNKKIIHNVTCDANKKSAQQALIQYLEKSVKVQ